MRGEQPIPARATDAPASVRNCRRVTGSDQAVASSGNARWSISWKAGSSASSSRPTHCAVPPGSAGVGTSVLTAMGSSLPVADRAARDRQRIPDPVFFLEHLAELALGVRLAGLRIVHVLRLPG